MKAGAFLFVGIAVGVASAPAAADKPTICAARPGKSTPPCTVPAGNFQIESGLVDWSVQSGDERDTSLIIGETMFKYGLTDRSDIEVDVTPWQRSTTRIGALRDRESGFGDVTVGYKQQLASPAADAQVALLPVVKIPTARHPLGNGKLEAGLLVPIGFSIASTPLSIGLTPELDWVADGDGHGHHLAMAQVVSLGVPANDQLSLSAELWGQWDSDPGGTVRQYSIDASIAYVPRGNLQLDAGANFGLNRATPDVELYVGVSTQF